jgi:hypothetical protein
MSGALPAVTKKILTDPERKALRMIGILFH